MEPSTMDNNNGGGDVSSSVEKKQTESESNTNDNVNNSNNTNTSISVSVEQQQQQQQHQQQQQQEENHQDDSSSKTSSFITIASVSSGISTEPSSPNPIPSNNQNDKDNEQHCITTPTITEPTSTSTTPAEQGATPTQPVVETIVVVDGLQNNTATTTSVDVSPSTNSLDIPFPHEPGKFPIHEAVYRNDMSVLISYFGEVSDDDDQGKENENNIDEKEKEKEQIENNNNNMESNVTLTPTQKRESRLVGQRGSSRIFGTPNSNEREEEDEEDEEEITEAGVVSINSRDSFGRTPLMYANRQSTVKYLIAKGTRVNLRDHDRQTAMHKAARAYPDILSLLLDAGAHIKRDMEGCTALHLCCYYGNVQCVSTMMSKGPRRVKAEARDKKGRTALHYALESSSSDEVTSQIVSILIEGGSLLDPKDREKKTPLHYASILGKFKSLGILLEKGANPDFTDIYGALSLHYAVTHQNGNKSVKQLVAKGCKVNTPDNTGQTPIFYASRSGHPKNVKALLRVGSLANLKDFQNKTPLHFSLDIANPTISSMLVSAGADVTLRYKYGQRGERLQRGKVNSSWSLTGGSDAANSRTSSQILNDNNENTTPASHNQSTNSLTLSGETSDNDDNLHADMFGFLPDVSSTAVQVKKWVDNKEYYSNLHKSKAVSDKIREKKWIKILANWKRYTAKKQHKIQNMSWKSVPESIRGELWRLVLTPLAEEARSKGVQFQDLLNNDSEFVKQIDLDIDRTYRNHIYFRERFSTGQQALFNVLKAYSIYDPEVGYCQGMSGIASILLMYMTEEEAFWALVGLMEGERYQLRGLFLPSFPLLYRHYAIHETLLHDQLPKVHAHFGVEGITTSMYATKWFLTVFSGNVPFPMLIRFWDLVLLNGYFVIHTLVIHLLRVNQEVLSTNQFEKILQFFSSLESNGVDTYSFTKGAKKHKISEKKIQKLLKKHDLHQAQLHIHPGVPINS